MTPVRRRRFAAALAALLVLGAGGGALAQPGSGIAVDRRGNVWFVDTGQGVWKLAPDGSLAAQEGPPFPWLALDLDDRHRNTRLPSSAGSAMRRIGRSPTVLLSSDQPIAIDDIGALFFTEPDAAGQLSLVRIAPGGVRNVRARLPSATESGPLRAVNGLATGAGGSILFTEAAAVHRVAADGALGTVVRVPEVPGCVRPPGYEEKTTPMLRGLAEGPDGTIWVAATGCSALLRVAPGGEPVVALRAEAPWSPTGVAVAGDDVHVLEYRHAAQSSGEADLPRVRRLKAGASP